MLSQSTKNTQFSEISFTGKRFVFFSLKELAKGRKELIVNFEHDLKEIHLQAEQVRQVEVDILEQQQILGILDCQPL